MGTSVTSAGMKAAADKAILAARPVVEVLKLFSVDVSPDFAKKGSGVAVEVISAVASDFGANNGYTKSTGTIKPATVVLDQHKKSSFTIADRDVLENELAPVWGMMTPASAKAVAKAVVVHAVGKLDYSHAKAVVTAAHATLANFTAIRAAVEAQDLNPADCTLILTPDAYADLLAVLPANVYGGDEAIRMGQIGAFIGFKAVIDSPNATKTSGDSETNGFGFVVPTGALAVAARVVKPQVAGECIEAGTVTDDETGFTFGTRVVANSDQGELTYNVDSLFGAALTYDGSANPNAPRYIQLKTA